MAVELKIYDKYADIRTIAKQSLLDEYYRTVDEDKELEKIKWSNLNSLKMDLVALIKDKTGESVNYTKHSVIELVSMAGISEKELLETQTISRQSNEENNIFNTSFNYDMSYLTNDKESIESLLSQHSAYYLDCLFCGITPYETPYERQVGIHNNKLKMN